MGRNVYVKSNRSAAKIGDAKHEGTSFKKLNNIRQIWAKYRKGWIELKRPHSFQVAIFEADNDETKTLYEFKTERRGHDRYIVECNGFSWVD